MEIVQYQGHQLCIPKKYAIPMLLSRFQTNTYEKEEISCIQEFQLSDCVLELGSSLGCLTVLLATKVSKVVAVEANSDLIPALEQTCQLNQVSNVAVERCIVDPTAQTKSFMTNNMSFAGSADRLDWKTALPANATFQTVPCVSIEDLERKHSCSFSAIVMDIEGGELPFLEQHRNFLTQPRIQRIMMELHQRLMNDPAFDRKCIQVLTDCGFRIKKRLGNVIYCERA